MDYELPNNLSRDSLFELESDFRENLNTRKVHALISTIFPISSIKNIGIMLDMDVKEVVNSLETLLALKFVKNSEKGFIPVSHKEYKYTFSSESIEQRRVHQKERLIQVANEILIADKQSDCSVVVVTNQADYDWYSTEVQKLNDLLLERSTKNSINDVIITSVSGIAMVNLKGGSK